MSDQYYYAQSHILSTPVYLLASSTGLMYVGSRLPDEAAFLADVKKYFKLEPHSMTENEQQLSLYIEEIKRFEDGHSISYDRVKLDLRGTNFQVKVWRSLLSIPYGETTHYQAIADAIGNRQAVRAVGGAIGANPILLFVPCHRVVGKNGALTGFSAGLDLKKLWLEHEHRK